MEQPLTIKNGPAAAAILAAGVGCLTLGVMTALVEAVAAVKHAMVIVASAGPLSGDTSVAVIVWLVAWAGLHSAWKDKQQDFHKVFTIALVLIALELIGTCPLFYELLASK